MADGTKIQWSQATWNPTTGCDQVSPGCDHCYALTLAKRLKAMGSPAYQMDGSPRTSGPGFALQVWPDRLDQPIRWTKPRMIFVNSMSDLFHPQVPDEFLARVFAVMALTPRHTYQVLTKRPARMRHLMNDEGFIADVERALDDLWTSRSSGVDLPIGGFYGRRWWPLKNVWLGTSVEDQPRAVLRIPKLVDTPAAVRFLSVEPQLGVVDLQAWLWLTGGSTAGPFYDAAGRKRFGGGIGGQAITHIPARDIHWVIVGGESGPGARPFNLDWARLIRDDCAAAGVAMFMKQTGSVWAEENGARDHKGGDPADWPEPFPREYPVAA